MQGETVTGFVIAALINCTVILKTDMETHFRIYTVMEADFR